MMPLIRAEVRKLITIRSTYVILALAWVLLTFLSFWEYGIKGQVGNTGLFMEVANNVPSLLAIFLAIIGVLSVSHEYRYNTIMYTLTSSNSRSKVLAAKSLVVIGFSILVTFIGMIYAVLASYIGAVIGNDHLATQYFYLWDTVWKALVYVVVWVGWGLVLGILLRHVAAVIAALLIIPSTVETLLALLLKDNAKYLPFSTLEQIHVGTPLSSGKAALIASAYLAGVAIITWVFFKKRDAN